MSKNKYNHLLLFSLYLSQGLPFGFQATALPAYLRHSGVSLAIIGYSTALSLPWMFKAFWSPMVDAFYVSSFGRRKSWIVPLQILLVASMLCAFFTINSGLSLLLINLFVMNFFAATQDIAVDALAVDILSERELGTGNIAQVVGYKCGMIVSGGILVSLTTFLPWSILFIFMAIIAILPLLMLIFFKEQSFDNFSQNFQKRPSIKDIVSIFIDRAKIPSFKWLLLFVLTYKSGEIIIDVMFKPFLIDRGISAAQIGLWLGTYGMIASVAGSFFGGYLSRQLGVYKGLLIASINRLFPLIFICILSLYPLSKEYIILSTLLEHFFGGALTTSLFAFMMANCDKRIGATHYTILASAEVLGKSPGSFFSGLIAERFGYFLTFCSGTFISAAVILFLPLYKKSEK